MGRRAEVSKDRKTVQSRQESEVGKDGEGELGERESKTMSQNKPRIDRSWRVVFGPGFWH